MKEKDKEVGKIYESYDYDSFTVIIENRGCIETDGVAQNKMGQFSRLRDNDEYVPEMAIVRVNLKKQIIDGRHTFEDRRANEEPIRYIIVSDPRFNGVSKRAMVLNGIFPLNKNNTKWSGKQLFKAAYGLGSGLANEINELISKHDNTFKWTDILALLLKREEFFSGRTERVPPKVFDNKKILEYMESFEFRGEFNYFLELNLKKANSAYKRGTFLRAAYEIIFQAKDLMDMKLVRRRLLTIPNEKLASRAADSIPVFQKMIIDWVNKDGSAPEYNFATIIFEVKDKLHRKTKNIIKEYEEELAEA